MSARPSKVSRIRRGCLKLFLFLFLMGLGLALAVITAMVALLNHFSQGLPDVGKLRYYEPSETTRIYSSDGKLIATLFKENRTWTPIEQISPYLRRAVLAIEDSRFYEHHGVDPIGVARAAVYDFLHKGKSQGASTITMQLARNLFLSPQQNMERKIKEMLLALQIEKKFTKDEILELYLNQIYFGSGAYGIQSAAKIFYNKLAKDLTPAEAALLAGLPQAPSEYSPLVDERAAKMRQILVLGRMVGLGSLSWGEYRAALAETRRPHFFAKRKQEYEVLEVPYFTTYVLHQLFQRYDSDLLYRGGLKIYTTVDLKLQQQAEAVVRDTIKAYGRTFNADCSAMVCIENKTGFIRAIVGGLGYSKTSQFNRAWQSRRHPGSSFKLFVYSAAMEAGYSPETVVPDTPATYQISSTETWSPKNSDGGYMGAINIKTALQNSRNVVAVKLLTMVGIDQVIDLAYRMGIQDKLYPHLSLALGAVDVCPLEMAAAYTVIPNGGMRIEPTTIKTIYDSEGNVVEDNSYPRQTEVLSETTAYIMTELLTNVVEHGTGTAAMIPGRKVAGKTGTTDDFRDAWFCGFTPQLTTAVWVGNDNNSKMVHSFGGDLPARIWNRFMVLALQGMPPLPFGVLQDGKVGVFMCSESKKRATNACTSTYKDFYAPGSVPTQYCPIHCRPGSGLLPNSKLKKTNPGTHLPDEGGPGTNAIPGPEDTPLPELTPDELPTPVDELTPGEQVPGGNDAIPAPPNQPVNPGPDRPAPEERPQAPSTPSNGSEM